MRDGFRSWCLLVAGVDMECNKLFFSFFKCLWVEAIKFFCYSVLYFVSAFYRGDDVGHSIIGVEISA